MSRYLVFFLIIEVQLIYNVLISAVQQSDSVIHNTYIYSFFKIYLFYLFTFGCTGSSLLRAGFL